MIIPVDVLPSEIEPQKSDNQELLRKDVREIIDKRIERCEIISNYSSGYIKNALKKMFHTEAWHFAQVNGLRFFDGWAAFKVELHKDEDGKVHAYVRFDPDTWDEHIQNAKREGEKRK